jgi:hypothetical protein
MKRVPVSIMAPPTFNSWHDFTLNVSHSVSMDYFDSRGSSPFSLCTADA